MNGGAEPSVGAVALMLLGVLPPDLDAWLTEDDIRTAADAYKVPVREIGGVMRELRRRSYVRVRYVGDTCEWRLTPSGVDAAAPLRPA